MKILNIDAFAEVKRQISFAGQTYAVEEQSVQEFIDNLKAAEALEASGTSESYATNFEGAVKMVIKSIPTLPEAVIRKLKVPALSAILQFIRGDLDPDATPATEAEATAAAGEEKKLS